jgi:hypothetical protein
MRRATTKLLLTVCTALPALAGGQAIPIGKLSAPDRVSVEKIDPLSAVHPLANGRVIVASRKRALAFDSTLAAFSIVADSSTLTPGTRQLFQIALIPGLADTTLIVDVNASGFLVVDPNGKVVRAVAAPVARDVSTLSFAIMMGTTMTDPKGRLIYRGSFPQTPTAPAAPGQLQMPAAPDSFPIVRADFDTRAVDTIAVIKMPSTMRTSGNVTDGKFTMLMERRPYPTTDAWVALADGSVAIVRGSDYHIDWVSPAGVRTASPKMPFDWRRISDEEKAKVVDSLTKVNAPINARADSAMTRGGPNAIIQRWGVVPPSEWPDYYPPVRDGGVRVDADGNIWILPSTSAGAQGGLLYDVVNRSGILFERVQLPSDCALGGFAPARVLYLLCTPPGPQRAPATTIQRRRIIN